MDRRVRASAPATVANVGCGFDVLGFALQGPSDIVEVCFAEQAEHELLVVSDESSLPASMSANTAGAGVLALLNHLGEKRKLKVMLRKLLPIGSGMGSSASSAVAALVATNALLGHPLAKKDLLPFALEAERVACGSAHADNAAPSLLGGFVLIRSYDPLEVWPLPCPEDLHYAVVHPNLELKTRDARDVMSKQLRLSAAISQSGNLAALVHALHTSNYRLIASSLQDHIAEPVRALLIPGFSDVKDAAMKAGALGAGISGSGPSVFALTNDRLKALHVAEAMQLVWQNLGIGSTPHVGRVNLEGAHVHEAHAPTEKAAESRS